MKKFIVFVSIALMVSLGGLMLASCGTSGGGGSGTGSYSVYARFSYPSVYLVDGAVNFSDSLNPVSGNDISDATVIASNETTGVSTVLAWVPGFVPFVHGIYGGAQELQHISGESVSLTISVSGETITGGPTETPNSTADLTAPADYAWVHIPFTISWSFSADSCPASHVWLSITANSTFEAFQTLVGSSTTSYTVTSAEVSSADQYYISVYPVNQMTLNGAKSGSVGVVGSAMPPSSGRTIFVY